VFPPTPDEESLDSDEDIVISDGEDAVTTQQEPGRSRSDIRKIPIPDIIQSSAYVANAVGEGQQSCTYFTVYFHVHTRCLKVFRC